MISDARDDTINSSGAPSEPVQLLKSLMSTMSRVAERGKIFGRSFAMRINIELALIPLSMTESQLAVVKERYAQAFT